MVPKCYGSFSLELCVGSSKIMRSVRLRAVIMLLQRPFSQQARQHIMKAVIDFEAMVYTENILHTDLHPRNIILVGEADFASLCPHKLFSGIYISPFLRWHEICNSNLYFTKWVNRGWQPWLEAEYKPTASTMTERNLSSRSFSSS